MQLKHSGVEISKNKLFPLKSAVFCMQFFFPLFSIIWSSVNEPQSKENYIEPCSTIYFLPTLHRQ